MSYSSVPAKPDELSSLDSPGNQGAVKPVSRLERTSQDTVAKLGQSKVDPAKRTIESLFKVVSETPARGNVSVLRLWRLWGPPEIREDSVLVRCEYDSSTYDVEPGGVLEAYQILDWHHLNNHSSIARVQLLDKKPSTLERPSEDRRKVVLLPIVRSFQALVETLGDGGELLLRVGVEYGKETIDTQDFLIVRFSNYSTSAFGRGPAPEHGTLWRAVDKVTQEGLVESGTEYQVLSQSHNSDRGWRAEMEKKSSDRKMFSLLTRNRVVE